MEQSPSWEAHIHLVYQEISRLLWNPKGHYLVTEPYTAPDESNPYLHALFL
jgi:hypothetical protein